MARNTFRLADGDETFTERFLLQFESGHVVDSVTETVASNAPWMIGNTVLAWIPFLLGRWALAPERRGPLRWLAMAAFVAFLPNAPYVVTDLIHLAYEGQQLGWSLGVIAVLVPIYAVFVLVGLTSYAACLRMAHRWLDERVGSSRAFVGVVLLNLACACGVYLGRVPRLNSWDFVADPPAVADGIVTMLTRSEALAYVATMTIVGALACLVTLPLARRIAP